MLTAWSFASVFGPLYIARMRETTGHYATALHVIAGVMAVSILLPIIVRPPRREDLGEKPRTFGLTPDPTPPRD
jgi:OFA family oxalate/formate antiporter-like MFS transporter